MTHAEYYVGLDLGQKQSFTAIAVVERSLEREEVRNPIYYTLEWREMTEPRIAVRHLERIPLGTSYCDVVERVRELVLHDALRGRVKLVVDGTGPGVPVVDLLRRDKALMAGCELEAVTITAGVRTVKGPRPGEWIVPTARGCRRRRG